MAIRKRTSDRTLVEALRDTVELREEVAGNLFIPRRFRKAAFTHEIRDRYVSYLDREIVRMQALVKAREEMRNEAV